MCGVVLLNLSGDLNNMLASSMITQSLLGFTC
jgi:hypothetical protein